MENKLKPCPFCGGEAKMMTTYIGEMREYNVTCRMCSCILISFTTEQEAINAWNMRVEA